MGNKTIYEVAISEHKRAIRQEYKRMWEALMAGRKAIRTRKLLIKQARIARRLDILSHYELKIPVTYIPGSQTVNIRYERS